MENIAANYLVPALTAFTISMATKGADGPARTLNLLWEYVFGKWNNRLEKEINARDSVKDYGNKIAEETEKIPKKYINQNPDISILGPALEASKFYIEKEEIRNLFAKVIGASFDTRKAGDVHHAFVEIIKQMNPLDASNLALFKDNIDNSFPIAQYLLQYKGKKVVTPQKNNVFLTNKNYNFSENIAASSANLPRVVTPQKNNVFLTNKKYDFSDNMAASLSNLSRLGLIDIDYYTTLVDDSRYKDFYEHHLYLGLKKELENDAELSKTHDLILQKGLIELTPFGRNFVEICF